MVIFLFTWAVPVSAHRSTLILIESQTTTAAKVTRIKAVYSVLLLNLSRPADFSAHSRISRAVDFLVVSNSRVVVCLARNPLNSNNSKEVDYLVLSLKEEDYLIHRKHNRNRLEDYLVLSINHPNLSPNRLEDYLVRSIKPLNHSLSRPEVSLDKVLHNSKEVVCSVPVYNNLNRSSKEVDSLVVMSKISHSKVEVCLDQT